VSTPDDQKKFRNAIFQADAFRMSIAMARLVHTRLWKTLALIEPRFQATGTFDSEIASAYSDAWALVDILHRVRDLSEQTHLLSAKDPPVQVFIRTTEPVKALRNHVQHFRSGIRHLPAKSEPLFGTLTWVSSENSQRCFSILSGSLAADLNSAGSVYDRHDGVSNCTNCRPRTPRR